MDNRLQEINTFVEKESQFVSTVMSEMSKQIVGQTYILERLLIGILTEGHLLLEGVPGLAKTLAVKTFSQIIKLSFKRVQFTPDLLPADLIGTLIYNQATGKFSPNLGPIFANIILADEINRAPAKVQSALLEAMQECQVTIGNTTYPLEKPFLVLATQNPIEQEGTYPLPEAQVDRFLMKLKITYPNREDEKKIIDMATNGGGAKVNQLINADDIIRARQAVEKVYVDDRIKNYVLDLVLATRNPEEYNLKKLAPLIDYGASPRASISLIRAAKAHAFLNRRGYVIPEDIKAIGRDVLRHRLVLSFEAEAEEMSPDHLIDELLTEIEVP